MTSRPFPRQRRHTLHFLQAATRYRPVFLETAIDITEIDADRGRQAERPGYTAYVVDAAATAIAVHPAANRMLIGRLRPRLWQFARIDAKITIDKKIDDVRVVMSAVVPDADRIGVVEIGRRIACLKDEDAATAQRYAPVRRLQGLPMPLGRLAYGLALRNPARKAELQGSFAVTSLGNSTVDAVWPMIGATLTFGVGRIEARPVVIEGAVAVRPVMRLVLGFDHRVIDGALAADVLSHTASELRKPRDGAQERKVS